jgi:lipopolysaccharide transport system permease protein
VNPISVDKVAPPAVPGAPPSLEAPIERHVRPVRSRIRLPEIFTDLPVVRVLAARDFKVKYKQSLLGPIWLIFQPLALLLAFLVAFKGLAGIQTSGVPYAVFALAGLTVWAFFQASVTIGTASLVSSIHLVKLTPCPRLAFPIASIIASLPAMAVTGVAALVSAAAVGALSVRVLLLPLGIAWIFLLTAGVVAITSAVTVRFRDILNGLPFLLQFGVFVSPVGYSPSQLDQPLQTAVELNPLTGVIEVWRWMILSGQTVDTFPLITSGIATALLLVLGWRVFTRLEVTMADDI